MAFFKAPLAVAGAAPAHLAPVAARTASVLRGCASDSSSAPSLGGALVSAEAAGVESGQREISLPKFCPNRALSVTELARTEWCGRYTELILLGRKPAVSKVMRAGSERHAQLESAIKLSPRAMPLKTQQRLMRNTGGSGNFKGSTKDLAVSDEESWALKFVKFVRRANQLLSRGLTREIPVIGVVDGVWIRGVIDEVQMPSSEGNPILVDVKTRSSATFPQEAQKRNARFQLMIYKYLWDTMMVEEFPFDDFCRYFNLNAQYVLSNAIREQFNSFDLNAATLSDVVTYFKNMCLVLPQSKEQLLLRYELQADKSLLKENFFCYDDNWVKDKIQEHLKFLMGEREAKGICDDERWKCHSCQFAVCCPSTIAVRK